jgi:hypothetical protein
METTEVLTKELIANLTLRQLITINKDAIRKLSRGDRTILRECNGDPEWSFRCNDEYEVTYKLILEILLELCGNEVHAIGELEIIKHKIIES